MLELGISEKALVDHIFVRLEPQVQDYVEVRNPQNAVQLSEVLAEFEERYSCKAIRGSRNNDNVERREQLIEQQKTDQELGHIYRYLETPEDSSVIATICEN
ncbi:uncharacterized protein TNCV_3883471 [Trichonephila clavipes]|nr:uncharacterized protein TNCV_3883471 [Trichonephila clavipes]